jgi:hypothetical protein
MNLNEDQNLLDQDIENQQKHTRCYENPDDWSSFEHDRLNSKTNWSLFIAIISSFFGLWPLCIISLCMVRQIKKDLPNWHRHWCKVNTAYYWSLFGLIFGLLEWITGIILLFNKFHH